MTEYRYRVSPTGTGRWAWETQRRPAARQGDMQYLYWEILTEGYGASDEAEAITRALDAISKEKKHRAEIDSDGDARAKQPWRTA